MGNRHERRAAKANERKKRKKALKVDRAMKASRIESGLAERARVVWDDMKTATLRTISAIYAEKNPDRLPDLRRAMIHNANLDLNVAP